MLKYNIKVEIDDIQVTDDGYYSFKWKAVVGKKVSKGIYDSSYEGYGPKRFKGILESGYALDIVLSKISEGN